MGRRNPYLTYKKLTPTPGWRAVNIPNKPAISLDVVSNLQPLESFSVVFV